MDELQTSEESAFVAEDVNNIIKESIDLILLNAVYSHKKVGQWTSSVVEACLKRLTALNKPFKYVGSRTVRWENKTMYCITTVFGLAI
eukprot:jgi/Chlat1/373/Chrsp10S01491